MHSRALIPVAAGLLLLAITGKIGATPSAEGAEVYLISPGEGETVTNPVTIRFGLRGMGVAPAGIDAPNTGHHHLVIDAEALPSLTAPLPADEHHIHFGGGQTETMLDLEPGEHTLRLILADYLHTPHQPPVISKPVTITVE